MRFINCTKSNEVKHAIKQVEKLLTAESTMIKELYAKTDWKYGSENVVIKLLEDKEPISVFTYRPWNPFTKAVGYFDGKAIHISVKALESFDFERLCGLLLHEYAHYCGFNHANNFKSKEKSLYSVPYYLSDNITKWI
jgi:hypothetical protein